jgi:hypothetical protein
MENSACNCNCKCEERESYVGGNTISINNNSIVSGTNTYNSASGTSALLLGTINRNSLPNTTTNFSPYHPKELKDVIVTPETIEIIYVQRAMYSYTQSNYSYSSDITFKEIYGCKEGALTLIKTEYGKVVPPREVPETYEFDNKI